MTPQSQLPQTQFIVDEAMSPSILVVDEATSPASLVVDEATSPASLVVDEATSPASLVVDEATSPVSLVVDEATSPQIPVVDAAVNKAAIPPSLSSIVAAFLTFALSAQSFAQESKLTTTPALTRSEFVDVCIAQVRGLDSDSTDTNKYSYVLCLAARPLSDLGRQSGAEELWELAWESVRQSPESSNWHRCCQTACEIGRVDLAESVVKASMLMKEDLLKNIDLHRAKQGDEASLERVIASLQDASFFDGLQIAGIYTARGEYAKAEAFVRGLKITEENAPEDMIGIALGNIARKLRDEGELAKAIEYADKAYQVAGRQYYTGHSITTLWHLCHGTLETQAPALAKQAAAYRGHQARDLLQRLVRDLAEAGLFSEAGDAGKLLANVKDRDGAWRVIAAEQAKARKFGDALASIRAIQSKMTRAAARVDVAISLNQAGSHDSAQRVLDALRKTLDEALQGSLSDNETGATPTEIPADALQLASGLVKAYTAGQQYTEAQTLIISVTDSYQSAKLAAEALQQLAARLD